MLVKRQNGVKFAITPLAFALEILTQQRQLILCNLMLSIRKQNKV